GGRLDLDIGHRDLAVAVAARTGNSEPLAAVVGAHQVNFVATERGAACGGQLASERDPVSCLHRVRSLVEACPALRRARRRGGGVESQESCGRSGRDESGGTNSSAAARAAYR